MYIISRESCSTFYIIVINKINKLSLISRILLFLYFYSVKLQVSRKKHSTVVSRNNRVFCAYLNCFANWFVRIQSSLLPLKLFLLVLWESFGRSRWYQRKKNRFSFKQVKTYFSVTGRPTFIIGTNLHLVAFFTSHEYFLNVTLLTELYDVIQESTPSVYNLFI